MACSFSSIKLSPPHIELLYSSLLQLLGMQNGCVPAHVVHGHGTRFFYFGIRALSVNAEKGDI